MTELEVSESSLSTILLRCSHVCDEDAPMYLYLQQQQLSRRPPCLQLYVEAHMKRLSSRTGYPWLNTIYYSPRRREVAFSRRRRWRP